jgi:hypothetical protein
MQTNTGQRDFLSFLGGCGGCLSSLGITAIFLLLGGGLAVWGWSILQNARASASWPTSPGMITRSEVTHSTDADGADSYQPKVTYEYLANNVEYESYTIKFGENSYSSRGRAEDIAATYPVGRQVTVYYDPGDPGNSVLEPGVTGGSYIVLGIGVLFVVISLVVGPLSLLFRHRG